MKAKDASNEALLLQLLLDYAQTTPSGRLKIIEEILLFDDEIRIFKDTTGVSRMVYPEIRETKETILEEIFKRFKDRDDQ